MDISEIEKQVKSFEKQAEEAFDSLEKKREGFEKLVLDFVSSWIQNRVKDALTKEFPDKAKALGEIGVRAIKADLKAAVDKLPADVKALLADNSRWPHCTEYRGKGEKYPSAYDFETLFGGLTRQFFGLAGKILDKHKLIKSKQYGEWGQVGTNIVYGYGIQLPDPLKALIADYYELYERHRELLEKIEVTKNQRAEAEAKDIWDKS